MNFSCYEGFSPPTGLSGEFNPDGESTRAGYDRRSCLINCRRSRCPPKSPSISIPRTLRSPTIAISTGPKFIKRGSRVLYRWPDVLEWLDRNTFQRTDEPRQQR